MSSCSTFSLAVFSDYSVWIKLPFWGFLVGLSIVSSFIFAVRGLLLQWFHSVTVWDDLGWCQQARLPLAPESWGWVQSAWVTHSSALYCLHNTSSQLLQRLSPGRGAARSSCSVCLFRSASCGHTLYYFATAKSNTLAPTLILYCMIYTLSRVPFGFRTIWRMFQSRLMFLTRDTRSVFRDNKGDLKNGVIMLLKCILFRMQTHIKNTGKRIFF